MTGSLWFKRAFTLLEMMVILAIMALMTVIGLPIFLHLTADMHVKADAQIVITTMKKARSLAAHYRKPVRAVLHCDNPDLNERTPCQVGIEAAVYNSSGLLDRWRKISNSEHILHRDVVPRPSSGNESQEMPLFASYKWLFQGIENQADALLTVVFLPSGEALTERTPFNIIFLSEKHNFDESRSTWQLFVANTTGHVKLSRRP